MSWERPSSPSSPSAHSDQLSEIIHAVQRFTWHACVWLREVCSCCSLTTNVDRVKSSGNKFIKPGRSLLAEPCTYSITKLDQETKNDPVSIKAIYPIFYPTSRRRSNRKNESRAWYVARNVGNLYDKLSSRACKWSILILNVQG